MKLSDKVPTLKKELLYHTVQTKNRMVSHMVYRMVEICLTSNRPYGHVPNSHMVHRMVVDRLSPILYADGAGCIYLNR